MVLNNKEKKPLPFPLFDNGDYLPTNPVLPISFLKPYEFCNDNYRWTHTFLYAYKNNKNTFNAYRRELQRLLLWAWLIHKKSIFALNTQDIEIYLNFCQKPLREWVGQKQVKQFIFKSGKRVPNLSWRPFVLILSKSKHHLIENPKTNQFIAYVLSEKSFREVFVIIHSFYNFLMQENVIETNPIQRIKQKSRFFRRRQGPPKIRRLGEIQWKYVLKNALRLASLHKKYERTLFIISILYSLYLRISELSATERWTPKMSDFMQDNYGNWWFTTVGKGNKERQIAVSDTMLIALTRWRLSLGLSPLPSKKENFPLLPKIKNFGPLRSTVQIRKIVQYCFDQAHQQLVDEGRAEEALNLSEATVHWLRHTGISDDIKIRPREHVRDDAGHSSSLITDKYIDVELSERHKSAKQKKIDQ